MEPENPSSNVDTSRPFRSVKEAVAIFGEQRLLIGFKSPPPPTPPQRTPPPPPPKLSPSRPLLLINKPEINKKSVVECEEIRVCSIIDEQEEEEEIEDGGGGRDEGKLIDEGLKKLEVELAETKKEVRLLKEREMETEVAVAALNAELHKSISRIAMAEASAAAKLAATPTRSLVGIGMGSMEDEYSSSLKNINNRSPIVIASHDEEIKHYPSLSEILSIGDQMSKKKKMMTTSGLKKQKPIVPLLGDLVSSSISSWKKRASTNATETLYYS